MAEETKPPGGTGGPPTGQVAPGPAGTNLPPVAPATSAQASVPLFGGFRGGRKRADGLIPGSPEAIEADRKKDAERKRLERSTTTKLDEPAALPSATATVTNPNTATPGAQSPAIALQAAPAVPWQADMLRSLSDELINTAEAARIAQVAGKIKEAELPEKIAREVMKDVPYKPVYKKMLMLSTPEVAAKGLNKLGISAEYKDEVTFVTSLAAILLQGRTLNAKLDELIAEVKASKETKPPEKKL